MLGKSAFVMLSPWKPHTYYLVGHGNLINKPFMIATPTSFPFSFMGRKLPNHLYHLRKLTMIKIKQKRKQKKRKRKKKGKPPQECYLPTKKSAPSKVSYSLPNSSFEVVNRIKPMKPLVLILFHMHTQPKKEGKVEQSHTHKGRNDSIFKARDWVRSLGRKEKLLPQMKSNSSRRAQITPTKDGGRNLRKISMIKRKFSSPFFY